MKTKAFTLILALAMLGLMAVIHPAAAQDIRLSGSVAYVVKSDGNVYNGSNSQIGQFRGNTLHNRGGASVGEIRGNSIYRGGSSVGEVRSGTVYNRSGQSIGEIKNGTIYTPHIPASAAIATTTRPGWPRSSSLSCSTK